MNAQMKPSPKLKNRKLTDPEVDEQVVAEANNEEAWDQPVFVHKEQISPFSLPRELVARATFLARLHHEPDLENWLLRIIRERIELEEAAFSEARRELATRVLI
jgi:hypothetical protein